MIAGVTVAIVAAVSGGGHAHAPSARADAATQPPADLLTAARYLGLSVGQLRDDLRAGETLAELANATPGKSARGVEDALVSVKSARIRAEVARGTLSTRREGARLRALRRRASSETRRQRGALRGPRADAIAAARYLGIPAQLLLSEERAGHPLVQIASSKHGRTTAGLIDAIVAARKKVILAAAASGRISHATESKLLAALRQRVSSEVNTP